MCGRRLHMHAVACARCSIACYCICKLLHSALRPCRGMHALTLQVYHAPALTCPSALVAALNEAQLDASLTFPRQQHQVGCCSIFLRAAGPAGAGCRAAARAGARALVGAVPCCAVLCLAPSTGGPARHCPPPPILAASTLSLYVCERKKEGNSGLHAPSARTTALPLLCLPSLPSRRPATPGFPRPPPCSRWHCCSSPSSTTCLVPLGLPGWRPSSGRRWARWQWGARPLHSRPGAPSAAG